MKKTIALLLVLVLALGLAACGSSTSASAPEEMAESAQTAEAPAQEASEPAEELPEAAGEEASAAEAAPAAEEPAEESAPAAEEEPAEESAPISVMVLNGTTGFGMAKLIADAQAGEAAQEYSVSVETDASNITAALISGSVDIAVLPTNAAATVYNKTEGGVQMAAINTLGVLYVVVNTEKVSVSELSDLDGMTVYVPAQNPTFIFRALTEAAELDVTIDNTYAQPADLRTALAAGEVDIAVLPEPMVTIACAANESLAAALDITELWENVYEIGKLVQGCVVVRTAFAEAHPGAVDTFLAEYGDSIAFLTAEPDDAAQLIEDTGIFQQAAVAKKAIPNCNVCFLTGEEMRDAMDSFCAVMFDLAPDSIGGAVPESDFYYIG